MEGPRPDPRLSGERLLAAGVEARRLEAIEAAVDKTMHEAVEEAKAAPLPPTSAIGTNLWADGGSAWRN